MSSLVKKADKSEDHSIFGLGSDEDEDDDAVAAEAVEVAASAAAELLSAAGTDPVDGI